MEKELTDYLEQYPELAAFMFSGTQNMILFSTAEGDIVWANYAFLDWIGYSLDEFTRKVNPVTWQDISVRDASLEADITSANKLKAGNIQHYVIRKFYVPKHGHPHFVELFVRRFPPDADKEMAICCVEVTPLHNTHEKMAMAYEKMAIELRSNIVELSESNKKIVKAMEDQMKTGLNGAVAWLLAHPLVGVPVAAVLVLLLFGDRALEVLQSFLHLGVPKQ